MPQVTCPNCKTLVAVHPVPGQVMGCPVCRTPLSDGAASTAPEMRVSPPPKPGAGAAPAVGRGKVPEVPVAPPGQAQRVAAGAAARPVARAVAPPQAAPVARAVSPAAGVPSGASAPAPVSTARPTARRGRGGGSAALILTILGLLLVVVTLGIIAVVVFSSDTQAPVAVGGEGWGSATAKTAASRQAIVGNAPGAKSPLRLGKVKVEVRLATFAVPRGRDANSRKVDLGDKALGVFLDIHNTGKTRVEYKSWYLAPFQAGNEPSAGQTALVDDQGRAYPAAVYTKASRLDGHTASASLGPDVTVSDALYFKVPSVDVKHFELILPAEAVGQTGNFKFRIDREMIQGG